MTMDRIVLAIAVAGLGAALVWWFLGILGAVLAVGW
jgi:hypothetical protein